MNGFLVINIAIVVWGAAQAPGPLLTTYNRHKTEIHRLKALARLGAGGRSLYSKNPTVSKVKLQILVRT